MWILSIKCSGISHDWLIMLCYSLSVSMSQSRPALWFSAPVPVKHRSTHSWREVSVTELSPKEETTCVKIREMCKMCRVALIQSRVWLLLMQKYFLKTGVLLFITQFRAGISCAKLSLLLLKHSNVACCRKSVQKQHTLHQILLHYYFSIIQQPVVNYLSRIPRLLHLCGVLLLIMRVASLI